MSESGGIRSYSRHRKAHGLPGTTHGAVRGAIERRVLTGASVTVTTERGRATYSIDFQAADREWAANVDAHQQGRAPKPQDTAEASPRGTLPTLSREGEVTMAQAQLVEQVYKAELRRAEYLRTVGELCYVAGVQADAARLGHEIREAILRVPVRLRALLAAESDPRRVESLLEAELRQALQGLVDGSA